MSKQVVLVGHCGADSAYIRLAVKAADSSVSIATAESPEELHAALVAGAALVLVNRVVDNGYPTDSGVDIIRTARQAYPDGRLMLVSNFEESQVAARAAGALPGFGKREIGTPRVKTLLKEAIQAVDTAAATK